MVCVGAARVRTHVLVDARAINTSSSALVTLNMRVSVKEAFDVRWPPEKVWSYPQHLSYVRTHAACESRRRSEQEETLLMMHDEGWITVYSTVRVFCEEHCLGECKDNSLTCIEDRTSSC